MFSNILDGHLLLDRNEVGGHAKMCVTSTLVSASLTLEPVVAGTPQMRGPGYHSLLSIGSPRYPFIDQLYKEDEQQNGLRACCQGWDRTRTYRFVARPANCYTMAAQVKKKLGTYAADARFLGGHLCPSGSWVCGG